MSKERSLRYFIRREKECFGTLSFPLAAELEALKLKYLSASDLKQLKERRRITYQNAGGDEVEAVIINDEPETYNYKDARREGKGGGAFYVEGSEWNGPQVSRQQKYVDTFIEAYDDAVKFQDVFNCYDSDSRIEIHSTGSGKRLAVWVGSEQGWNRLS